METYYSEKICLVSGAASGIGKAVCQALLAQGACVIAVDINEPALREWSTEYDADSLHINALDVTDYGAFDELISAIVKEHKSLDFL